MSNDDIKLTYNVKECEIKYIHNCKENDCREPLETFDHDIKVNILGKDCKTTEE